MSKQLERRKYCCLVSVGSRVFSPAAVRRMRRWARSQDFEIEFVILDELEAINLEVFEGMTSRAALKAASRRSEQRVKALGLADGEVLSWRVARSRVKYAYFSELIGRVFAEKGAFYRAVINQVFRNLQPRFRKLGVEKNSHPVVERASGYLVQEVAWKAAAFCSGPYHGEILPYEENMLILELYSGKYLSLAVREDGYEVVEIKKDVGRRFYETDGMDCG